MSGTKTVDWLKCNICFNVYDVTKLRPRSLSCGHTFCEGCLNSTIQNKNLLCPQCRKTHYINSVLDLPVNFTLEGILKSLNSSSQDLGEVIMKTEAKEESMQDNRGETVDCLISHVAVDHQQKKLLTQNKVSKISSGMCHDHPSMECMYRCSSHMCWVCKECIEGEGDHSESDCEITSFKDEIEQRKEEYMETLEDEKDSCVEVLSIIQKHILYLAHERERHITLGNKLNDLAEMHKKEEENLHNEMNLYKKFIENGEIVKEKLLEDKASIMTIATLNESNSARDLVKTKKKVSRNWINTAHGAVFVGKLKIKKSTLAVLSEESLMFRDEMQESNNNVEMNCAEMDLSEVIKCSKKSKGCSFFFSCLQCRIDDSIIMCGTCFVNSEHVNHIHELDSSSSWTCDCGGPELWKSNPACMKHLKNDESTPEPYDKIAYASSKCKEIFKPGEITFSCLDCRKNVNNIFCGTCFINSAHRFHTYEVQTIKGKRGFCDCGCKEAWKSENTCDYHNMVK